MLADKSREDLPGKDKKEVRDQLLEEASNIYQAESAAQARQRLAAVSDTWRQRARHPR